MTDEIKQAAAEIVQEAQARARMELDGIKNARAYGVLGKAEAAERAKPYEIRLKAYEWLSELMELNELRDSVEVETSEETETQPAVILPPSLWQCPNCYTTYARKPLLKCYKGCNKYMSEIEI